MGSKSSSSSAQTTHDTTNTTTNVSDSRDLSDRRNFKITDKSVDKRAVLKDATQILDSVYVNVDSSDEVLQSTVRAWQGSAEALINASRFDNLAAKNLLGDITRAAQDGVIAVTEAQIAQMSGWQAQLEAALDFSAGALATGERLVQQAGTRQASVTARILDLAAGAVGHTSSGQIRIVGWTLAGVALVLLASKWRGSL